MRLGVALLAACCIAALSGTPFVRAAEPEAESALEIFRRRILPIFKAQKPSSCTECHLAGVELHDYIRPDQEQTFALLVEAGMIDVQRPDDSKLLAFIRRGGENTSPLTKQVREQELAAFSAWIRAATQDPRLLAARPGDEHLGPVVPPEVIRHARSDRVLASFVDQVWSQMGRCVSCHSPAFNERVVRRAGEQVSWIAPGDPLKTLSNLVEAGDIDLDNPDESPVLTKPAGLSEHGGGPKFAVGDPAYLGFRSFLRDYAATVGGRYQKSEDLPKDPDELLLLTKHFLRITDLPAEWGKLPMAVDLYRWDETRQAWSAQRWGTVFNPVFAPKQLWQGMVHVAAPYDSMQADDYRQDPKLPPGRYLAKVYLDRQKKTADQPEYRLGEAELLGQFELSGDWPIGFKQPRVVKSSEFLKRD